MKIVIFDNKLNVIDVMEGIIDPIPISPSEISWYGGGVNGVNANYVILEDNEDFSQLNQWDILAQLKEQYLFEITRVFEDLRIAGQVYGYRQDHNKLYQQTRQQILQATSLEDVRIVTNQFTTQRFPKPPELDRGYIPPSDTPLDDPIVEQPRIEPVPEPTPVPDSGTAEEEEPVIRFINEE